jgi:S-adenosylmethionine uptake transporter
MKSPSPEATRSGTLAGIGLMLTGIALFSINDALGKWLLATYSVGELLLVRSATALILLAPFVHRAGFAAFRHAPRPAVQLVRIVLSTLEVAMFFWAVSYLPLADTVTFYLAGPIYVTALSVLLLGERVGWRRWSAVFAGFVGVLIVIRPGFGMAHWALALPLVPAVGFALYQILTRKVSGTPGETALAMLFHLAWVGALMLSAVVPFFWQTIAPLDWLPMAAMGALGGLGHLILIRALTIAPASLLAPFAYSQIVWALVLGYLVFGDMPDRWMLIGCCVIVASGLYVFYREAVVGKT